MVELRVLGAVHLRDAEGHEIRSLLRQPKRLALLTRLVLGTGDFTRRDTLTALFWPEHDQEHARAALRKAVHDLRAALGEEIVVNRGREEIGIAAEALWCDATAFTEAAEAGWLAEALALYRGDLLEGFYLDTAPDFAWWLDEERSRLRRRAAEVAQCLAQRAAEEGEMGTAVHWAHRAVALTPENEEDVRRLIRVLDRAADRVGALSVYENFARRLRTELGIDPSQETEQLVNEIRSRTHTAVKPSPPLRGRPTAARRSLPGHEVERDAGEGGGEVLRVAVLPFTVHARGDYAFLREGLVDLLSTSLDGVGRLRSLDPRTLLGRLVQERVMEDDLEGSRTLAQRLKASHYLLGSVVEAGGRLKISASFYAVGGDAPLASAEVLTTEMEIFEAVDELMRRLVLEQQVGPGARLRRLALLTTHSLAALKEYLAGESAFRLGRSALNAYQRAVEIDPTFSLAHYRLSIAAGFNFEIDLCRSAAFQALAHADRLSKRDCMLLEAYLAYLEGAFHESERLYRAIVGLYPDELEAWYQLGEVFFHLGPVHGHPIRESREAFRRALLLDSEHGESLVHLAAVAAAERDYDRVRELHHRLRATGELPVQVRAIDIFLGGTPEEQTALLGELEQAGDVFPAIAARYVASSSPDLRGAERISRLLVSPQRSHEARALGYLLLAHWALAEGRWKSAKAELAWLETLEPNWARIYRALFLCAPFLSPSPAELDAIRQALLRWQPEPPRPRPIPSLLFSIHDEHHLEFREYLIGLLSARLRDLDSAHQCAESLERHAATTGGDLARSLAGTIRAHVALIGGAEDEAVEYLESVRLNVPWERIYFSPFYGQAHQRFLRAGLLLRTGREGEALQWYDSLDDFMPLHLPYAAPSHLHRGEIYTRLDEWEKAREHFGRFTELWRECDPELRPRLNRVKAEIHSLQRFRTPGPAQR